MLATLGVGSLLLFPAVSINAQGLRSNVAAITLRVSKPQDSGTAQPLTTRDARGALPPHWGTADEVRVEIDPAPSAAAGGEVSPRVFVRDARGRFAPLQPDSTVLVGTGAAYLTVVSFRTTMPATLSTAVIAVRYVARWGSGSARVEQLHSIVSFPSPVRPAP